MATYSVKVTWRDAEDNAACLGCDTKMKIVADSEASAKEEAIELAIGYDAEADCYQDRGYHPVAELLTWCVCGQEAGEHWEPVEYGLATLEDAEAWMRAHAADFPDYVSWYIDEETNDGHAEAYWDVRDGELVHTN